MMAPLLIFFRQLSVEFWSIDQSHRLLPVIFGIDNTAPLFFLVNGDQISMDQNAKSQFYLKTNESFGDYWNNLLNSQFTYNRFNAKYPFSSLLPYAIKENILPDIIRFHFSGHTLESFLNSCKTIIIFESFLDELHRNRVTKELIEIVGFNPSSLVSFEYWEIYRAYYEKQEKLDSKESFININTALGDLNINLIAQNPTLTLNKKILKGRGNDPRLDTILEYIAEIAVRRGSLLSIDEIKKEIHSEGIKVLNLLNEGWISYTIRNYNIDVYPLPLEFHRDAIANRLNNRSTLNFIQSEFENFRNANQAGSFKIFLNGEIINQEIYVNFFKSTYSNVSIEPTEFDLDFTLFIFDYNERQSINQLSTTNQNQEKRLGFKEKFLAPTSRQVVNVPPPPPLKVAVTIPPPPAPLRQVGNAPPPPPPPPPPPRTAVKTLQEPTRQVLSNSPPPPPPRQIVKPVSPPPPPPPPPPPKRR